MALLRAILVAITASLLSTAGCSLVLDADDLKAEHLDISGDTVGTADTVRPADSTTPTDTAAPPTDATAPSDTTAVEDTTGPADTAAPAPVLVIKKSGVGGCQLDYHSVIVTGCPETCPDKGGWTLVFDASASTGVTSFDWRFSATEMYDVQPKTATGGRVEITLDVPGCELLQGATIGSATIYATLIPNGDEAAKTTAQLDFVVRQVTSCGSTQGTCPDPQ